MAENNNTNTFRILPGIWTIPLIFIAFWGCVEGGCQGALNAQSKAVYDAAEYGGWLE